MFLILSLAHLLVYSFRCRLMRLGQKNEDKEILFVSLFMREVRFYFLIQIAKEISLGLKVQVAKKLFFEGKRAYSFNNYICYCRKDHYINRVLRQLTIKRKIKLHHFSPWNKNKFKIDYNLNVKNINKSEENIIVYLILECKKKKQQQKNNHRSVKNNKNKDKKAREIILQQIKL